MRSEALAEATPGQKSSTARKRLKGWRDIKIILK